MGRSLLVLAAGTVAALAASGSAFAQAPALPRATLNCYAARNPQALGTLEIVDGSSYRFTGRAEKGTGTYRQDPASGSQVTWLSGPLQGTYSTWEPSAYNRQVMELYVAKLNGFCRLP